jgi:hypothetical protein
MYEVTMNWFEFKKKNLQIYNENLEIIVHVPPVAVIFL